MAMYQLDPDVVRWGLHLIDVCSISNDASPDTVSCYQKDLSQTQSMKEDFSNQTRCFVENDEIIARALQEELSKLADAQIDDHHKESILAQDWRCPSGRQSNSGEGGLAREVSLYYFSGLLIFLTGFQNNPEEYGRSGRRLIDFDGVSIENEDQDGLPEIEDESAIDGELGKRLNQMVPIPHVPKINGEIPSADEATSDHQRLLDRLQLYDLVELKIAGDGNCQFRSLSDQIYRTPEHHKFVREQVVKQLKSRPDLYENYVPMAYGEYLKNMSRSGEWGDHITLQAAADWYGVKIFVVTSFKDTCYIEILPQTDQKSHRIIFLSFWAEVHYNSIYPLGELPLPQSKKKKWWRWT